MVRRYDTSRPVPADLADRIVGNGLRASSAGFSQGWCFLVLDNPADVARFREAVHPQEHPEDWFAAQVAAPLLIVPHSNKDAYLYRYALPDKGFTDVGCLVARSVLGYRHRLRGPADVADRRGMPGWAGVSSASRSSGSVLTGRRSACRRNSPRSERSPSATATRRHGT
jgi:nitroreductase